MNIFIKQGEILRKYVLIDIYLIKANGDYCTIYLESPDKLRNQITIRSTMIDILKKLDNKDFIRIHNSYIININYINSIDENLIYLTNNYKEGIPSNREKLKELKSKLIII